MSTDTREDAPPPPGARPRRRRAAIVALVLAVVLAIGGVVLVVSGLAGGEPPPPPASASGAVVPAPAPTSAAPAAPTAPSLAASVPTRIAIPSIGVDSPVNPVGLNPDRTLEVPAPGPLYDQAAWYRGSVTPGQAGPGPSVILGHVDSAKNGPSVFYRLGALRPGAAFTVTRADGSVLSFRVDDVRSYPKNAFPTLAVYGNTPRSEVRLITCGGDFDSAARSYVDNTVVFAHLVT